MKKFALTLGVGLLGGIIPLAAYLSFIKPQETNTQKQEAKRELMYESNPSVQAVNNISEAGYIDFREASKNTIHSVVHVKTIVIQNTYQSDTSTKKRNEHPNTVDSRDCDEHNVRQRIYSWFV